MKVISANLPSLVKLLILCCTLCSAQLWAAGKTQLLTPANNQYKELRTLTLSDVQNVMTTGPRLVVMWSLECPACFEELDAMSLLLIKYPDFPITLISTDDDITRRNEINEVYQPTFASVPRWVYTTGKGLQLRHAIDKNWQGELPRSFYIDKAGQKHGFSGLLTDKHLNDIVSLLQLKSE